MSYDGRYVLSEFFDANEDPIQLPVGRFEMTVAGVSGETTDSTSGSSRYRFSIKIGNSIGGSFTVSDADGSVKMGPTRSTMMMPSPELYALENKFNAIMPEVNTVALSEGKLTLAGGQGQIVFKKE